MTGDEIKALLEEANRYQSAGDNNSLKLALGIYDRIIEAAPEPFYYADRSRLKYRLDGVTAGWVDSAIGDINKAIELDPDRGEYYRYRGDYQLYRLSKDSPPYNIQSFRQLAEDYRACISKSPTASAAWVSLIAVNIMTEDFDEAISLYGQCAFYADESVDKLGRSLLGCIALIMAGDKVEEDDLGILNNKGSELKFIIPYITAIIPYLNYVKRSNDRKWGEISRIVELYIRHYDSWHTRNTLLERVKLREPVIVPERKAYVNAGGKSDKLTWIWVPGLILAFFGFISLISGYSNNTTPDPSYTFRPSYTINFDDLDLPTYYPLPSFPSYPTVSPLSSDLQKFLDSLESAPAASASRGLEIISITSSVAPDGYATLKARGLPGVEYNITVIYYSGPSKASGLVPKTADEDGNVSWTWHVGPGTRAGKWEIIISGGGEEETTYFTVTK